MKKRRSLHFLLLLLLASGFTLLADRVRINLPSRWTKKVTFGITNVDYLEVPEYARSGKIDYANNYLNGGLYPTGWTTQFGNWTGEPGSHMLDTIKNLLKSKIIPTFTYYQLVFTNTGESDVKKRYMDTIKNAQTMHDYWVDVKYFFEYAGQFPEQLMVLHIEPDFWGYAQLEGGTLGVDWSTQLVQVAGSGDPDLAALPNTIGGFAQAFKVLRDKMAPNVVLAYHNSFWTSGIQKKYSECTDAELLTAGRQSADYFKQLPPAFDIIFSEVSLGDSAYDGVTLDPSKIWTETDFSNHAKYIRALTDKTHLPVIIWQIAVGNTKMRCMNNTDRHYQSSFIERFMGNEWNENTSMNLDAGIVGYMFMAGNVGESNTRLYDWAGDGVTNPPPINGNTIASVMTSLGTAPYYDYETNSLYSSHADDDEGGYFRWCSYLYHLGAGQAIVNEPDIELTTEDFIPVYNHSTVIDLESNTDFTVALSGQTYIDRTFLIRNIGTTDLLLNGSPINIVGADANDFKVLVQPDQVIKPANQSCFIIRFQPNSVAGEKNAKISFSCNDSTDSNYSFSLRGKAIDSNFKPTDISGCSIWVDASQISGVSDGQRVEIWNDLSGHNNNLNKDTYGATLVANALKGNSVLRFTGDASYSFSHELTDILTVFWLVKENQGVAGGTNGAPALLGHIQFMDFMRNTTPNIPNPPLWDPMYASNDLKYGVTRINGEIVDGTSTNMPTDYSIISLISTGNLRADSVQNDRNKPTLWQGDWGELIIYNRKLEVGERESVETYLHNKWLKTSVTTPSFSISGNGEYIQNGTRATSADDNTFFNNVTIGDSTTHSFVIYNTGDGTLNVNDISISGVSASEYSVTNQSDTSLNPGKSSTFTIELTPDSLGLKEAIVTISSNDSQNGTFTFAIQGYGLPGNIGEGPLGTKNCLLWLDASDLDGDGINEGINETGITGSNVTLWHDKSENGNNAVQNGQDALPLFSENSLNGMPTVNFDGDNLLHFNMLSGIRTVFWVLKEDDYSGAHFFLGHSAAGAGVVENQFHRGLDAGFNPNGIIWDDQFASTNVIQGSTYLDGNLIDGTTTKFPLTDFHRLTLVANGPLEADQLTKDRGNAGRSWKGNIAEIIIYDKVLTDQDRQNVENYLKNKWFDTNPLQYTLTVVNGSPSGSYNANSQVNISATIPAGQTFDKWTGDATYVSDITSPNTTVSMPSKNITITATFTHSQPGVHTIAGTISGDISRNVLITALDANNSSVSFSATSDASGNYTIINVPDGEYDISASLSGYTFNPNEHSVTIQGQNVSNCNFDATSTSISTHSISGTITGVVQQGITLTVDSAHTALTDASGHYTITGLTDGAYTVTPALAGYTFTPVAQAITIAGSDISTGADFSATSTTGGVKYTLTVNNGNGSGEYSENDSVPINATVPAGEVFDIWTWDTQYVADINAAATTVTMPARNITITANFKKEPDRYNVSGNITDVSDTGISGVTITMDNYSTLTDANGHYIISGVPNGLYILTPTHSNYSFTPTRTLVTVHGSDVSVAKHVGLFTFGNTPPITTPDSYFVQSGVRVPSDAGLLTNDIDPDGDELTAKLMSHNGGVDVLLYPDGSFTFTAPAPGNYTFTYAAHDGISYGNTVDVDITVLPSGANSPTAVGDKYYVAQDSELKKNVNLGVLSNDLNVAGLTATLVTGHSVTKGDLKFNGNGSFTYNPNSGFSGVDSFEYQISDGTHTSSAIVILNVAPVNVTIGLVLNYRASDVKQLKGGVFAKPPKLYGVFKNGKKGSFKKIKSSNGSFFSGAWCKKMTLYDKNALKGGYKSYYDSNGPDKPATITVMVKGKTLNKTKIDSSIQKIQLVPPVITGIQDSRGNPITSTPAESTITIVGKYFGDKPPKVAIEVKGKLLRCKVEKPLLGKTNYKGNPSVMDSNTGKSLIKVILPSNKLTTGTYPIVLDNKIGIATTLGKKGTLPEITIKK